MNYPIHPPNPAPTFADTCGYPLVGGAGKGVHFGPGLFGPFWPFSGHFGSFFVISWSLATLGHFVVIFGYFGVIFGHFGAFQSGHPL